MRERPIAESPTTDQSYLLWSIDHARVERTIRAACAAYQQRFQAEPTLVLVHPDQRGVPSAVDGVTVQAWAGVTINHLWIGQREDDE
jgi:hypothetical protein